MAQTRHLIGTADEVENGGPGLKFEVERHGKVEPAFVVRHDGRVYAYFNRCAHVPIELDWENSQFWDITGRYLVCATHGATYRPDNGLCIFGPCKGRSLETIPVIEEQGEIFWLEDTTQHG